MKKRIFLTLLIVILFTGCTKEINKEKVIYNDYVKELEKIEKTSDNIPFSIETKFDKIIDGEIRYQVIIDNVKEDIFDIEAISIHNHKTNDIFPSIGIFDEKQDLFLNKKPSGVILVGYIDYKKDIEDFKCKIKLLVKYKTSDKKEHKVYYVTKK